ncbi:MAG: BON domain-containing protein [Steroidobacteraceae bacterium]
MRPTLISSAVAAALAATTLAFATGASAQLPAEPGTGTVAPATAVPAKPDVNAAAENVKKALQAKKDVPAGEITVGTHADTIIVSGEVSSAAQAAAAQSTAEAASEGARVSTNIEVRPDAEQSAAQRGVQQQEAGLVRNVEQALQRDSATAGLGVQVSVRAPDVIGLHGLVPTAASRQAAGRVAAQVAGVKRVDNQLQIPAE